MANGLKILMDWGKMMIGIWIVFIDIDEVWSG